MEGFKSRPQLAAATDWCASSFAMADDLDLDEFMAELDLPTSSAKPTSLKPSRFRPKPKGAPAAAAKAPTKAPIKPKSEPIVPTPTPAPASTPTPTPTPAVATSSSLKPNPKLEPDAAWPTGDDAAEIEADAEVEDEVVREIDVFLTPSLDEDESKVTALSL